MAMFEGNVNATEDVNPSTESSTVETAPEPTSTSSEETLNTQEQTAEDIQKAHEAMVTYERFKEVNDQLQTLKQSEDWVGYQKLKNMVDSDPYFAQGFAQLVYQKNVGQLQQPGQDPYANYPQEIAEPLRKTQILEHTVQQLVQQNQIQQQQVLINQYVNNYQQKLTENKVPEHWKTVYLALGEFEATKLGNNLFRSYDPSIIDRVYQAVDQALQGARRAERGSYVVDKSKDITPASTSATGVASRANQVFSNQNEKANYITEILKQASRG